MFDIRFDFSHCKQKMKPMHCGGQPPVLGLSDGMMNYITEAGIPYCRLHDVGGLFGGNMFVDIPNIFRDFDADETKEESYDFAFTDILLKMICDAGSKPYFRLGVTIENFAKIKSYRIDPPKDYDKWARICEHIIAHYNHGWANGFHMGIEYFEIWNEPDGGKPGGEWTNEMWTGSAEDYYRLYDTTAKHLKTVFPEIKIGGYASCGFYAILKPENTASEREQYFLDFFYGFFEYIKEHKSPIDFFSWHSYANADDTLIMQKFVNSKLKSFGYGDIEQHLNEWNPYHELRGTSKHSSEVMAFMCAIQKTETALLAFYDTRLGASNYGGLFNPMTYKPLVSYYCFVAFNHLFVLGNEYESECDAKNIYVLAASDGYTRRAIIANTSQQQVELSIYGAEIAGAKVWIINENNMMTLCEDTGKALETIPAETVYLIEFVN